MFEYKITVSLSGIVKATILQVASNALEACNLVESQFQEPINPTKVLTEDGKRVVSSAHIQVYMFEARKLRSI